MSTTRRLPAPLDDEPRAPRCLPVIDERAPVDEPCVLGAAVWASVVAAGLVVGAGGAWLVLRRWWP